MQSEAIEYKYIVTVDNPLYPSVKYCVDILEAVKVHNDIVASQSDEHGEYKAKVTIARLLTATEITTTY